MKQNKLYIQYANDVLSGKKCACEAIFLACKRFISWFERDDIYFDYDNVDRMIRFVSRMKHYTGQHNGKPFILLDYQSWIIANIFGWKYKDTDLRVTNNVFIMMARKGGKTAFASAVALCCAIADGENNAEVELVANSRQQAHIAFDAVNNFAESLDPKKKIIHRYRDSILIPSTKSKIQVLSSDSMGNDGYNSSCFLLDEFHAMKDWDLYNVMKSSQGMRSQPLAIIITTAGFLLSPYPCYEYRQTCIDILKGLKEDDSTFSAIYELDPDDNYQDESCWEKCQPSLGQTVSYKYMRDQVQSAINQPAQEVGVKTKNFNIFCQSSEVWLNDNMIQSASENVDLKDYAKEECYIGVDLSVVSDLTVTSIMFPPNPHRLKHPDKYVFKTLIYLPESALQESTNKELYKQWHRNKHLILTKGNAVDYDEILDDQLVMNHNFDIIKIAYDRYCANQWAENAERQGLPMQPFSQSLLTFSIPTKQFELLLRRGEVVIDDNPITRWCFGNVELKWDWNDNCKPIKAGGVNNKKIDVVIGMLQALGAFVLDGNKEEFI